jgi:hypothetical protein
MFIRYLHQPELDPGHHHVSGAFHVPAKELYELLAGHPRESLRAHLSLPNVAEALAADHHDLDHAQDHGVLAAFESHTLAHGPEPVAALQEVPADPARDRLYAV